MDKKTTATIRDRGQVTIPAEVRKQAQLDEGAIVEFEVLRRRRAPAPKARNRRVWSLTTRSSAT